LWLLDPPSLEATCAYRFAPSPGYRRFAAGPGEREAVGAYDPESMIAFEFNFGGDLIPWRASEY
jgi:hypothetical protein